MKSLKFIIPLLLFFVMVGFLALGLNLNPREVPSPLIDKAAPAFSLPRLDDPSKSLGRDDLTGRVWLLNVWASWCVACREEHPLLVEYAKQGTVPIYGLNYKDGRDDALRWLARWGNPYTASVSDSRGQVGIDFGVYGVPETFVIDKKGYIRFKQIGPITPDVLRDKIGPLVRQLQAEHAQNPA